MSDTSPLLAEELHSLSRKTRISFVLSLLTIATFFGLLAYFSLQVKSLASEASNLKEQIRKSQSEIELLSSDLARKKKGVELLNQAFRYFFDHKFEDATRTLKTFMEVDPDGRSAQVLNMLGYTELRLGISLQTKAQGEDLSNKQSDLNAASQAFKQAGEFLETAIKADPKAFLPTYNMILAKYYADDKQGALDWLEQSLKSQPRIAKSICGDAQFRKLISDGETEARFRNLITGSLKEASQACLALKPYRH